MTCLPTNYSTPLQQNYSLQQSPWGFANSIQKSHIDTTNVQNPLSKIQSKSTLIIYFLFIKVFYSILFIKNLLVCLIGLKEYCLFCLIITFSGCLGTDLRILKTWTLLSTFYLFFNKRILINGPEILVLWISSIKMSNFLYSIFSNYQSILSLRITTQYFKVE